MGKPRYWLNAYALTPRLPVYKEQRMFQRFADVHGRRIEFADVHQGQKPFQRTVDTIDLTERFPQKPGLGVALPIILIVLYEI